MIVDRYDAFLLDLDGVLFLGDEAAPGAQEAGGRLLSRRLMRLRSVPAPSWRCV